MQATNDTPPTVDEIVETSASEQIKEAVDEPTKVTIRPWGRAQLEEQCFLQEPTRMVRVIGGNAEYASIVPTFEFMNCFLDLLSSERQYCAIRRRLDRHTLRIEQWPEHLYQREVRLRNINYKLDTEVAFHGETDESRRVREGIQRIVDELENKRKRAEEQLIVSKEEFDKIRKSNDEMRQEKYPTIEKLFVDLGVLPDDAQEGLSDEEHSEQAIAERSEAQYVVQFKDGYVYHSRDKRYGGSMSIYGPVEHKRLHGQDWPENNWNGEEEWPVVWRPSNPLMHQLLKVTLDCPENNWNNAYGDEELFAAHRLELLKQARDRAQQQAYETELAFDAHQETYHDELHKFIIANQHRADAIALEDEFGGIWLKRTRRMTRIFESAMKDRLESERNYERAKALARVTKLKAVKLDPLQRKTPHRNDLGKLYVSDRKRRRITDWLDTNEAKEYPQKKVTWKVKSVDGVSAVAGGAMRRKVDELDDFCNRVPGRDRIGAIHQAHLDMDEYQVRLTQAAELQLEPGELEADKPHPELEGKRAVRARSWP